MKSRFVNPISNRVVCKLGTLSHNRRFTPKDLRQYTGADLVDLYVLVRRKIVEATGRGRYYPTSHGWEVIERACRMGSKPRGMR